MGGRTFLKTPRPLVYLYSRIIGLQVRSSYQIWFNFKFIDPFSQL